MNSNYQEVDPQKAHEMMASRRDLVVLDVRDKFEYDEAHIEGAKLIPMKEINDHLSELDGKKPTLCVCRGGFRSEHAARVLLNHDFKEVFNMKEGMKGWIKRGFPVAP